MGQSLKVQPLFGWSGLCSLSCNVCTSKLHIIWSFLWRTRCGIATAIRRNDISKLCCDAVKLHPWRQGPLRLAPLEQAGPPLSNSLRDQTWRCLPILWYWCFMLCPSLPVMACATCPRCFELFSHLWILKTKDWTCGNCQLAPCMSIMAVPGRRQNDWGVPTPRSQPGRHTSWSGSNSEPRKGGLSKNPKQRPKKGPRKKPRRRKPRRTERLKLRPKKRPRPNWRRLNSGCTRRLFQFKQEVFNW